MFVRSLLMKGAAGAIALAGSAAVQAQQEPQAPLGTEKPPMIGVGMPAPQFELRDTDGKVHNLKMHRGKVIVLEWFNPACSDVRNQHLEGSMATLCRDFESEKGIVWLGVNSVAPDKKGGGLEATVEGRTELNVKFPVLLDESGNVARMYGVLRTPTVFVIDTDGMVRYFGAIDNTPRGKMPKDAEARHIVYLEDALRSLLYGSELAVTTTEATGCPLRLRRIEG